MSCTSPVVQAQDPQVLPVIVGLTHASAAAMMTEMQVAYGVDSLSDDSIAKGTISTNNDGSITTTSDAATVGSSGGSIATSNSASVTDASIITLTTKTQPAMLQDMGDMKADFAVVESPAPAALANKASSLAYYPILAAPIVVTYRLEDDTPNTVPLTFNLNTISRIYRGNITMWNDPAIAATNPGVTLPARNISLYAWTITSGGNAAFIRTLAANDPDFVQDAGITPSPSGFNNYSPRIMSRFQGRFTYVTGWSSPVVSAQTVYIGNSRAVLHGVISTPYSMGYAYLSVTNNYHAAVANLINAAGSVVTPTVASAGLAMTELKPPLLPSVLDVPDVSNPRGGEAWPITSVISVVLDRTRQRTSCSTKTGALQFVLWMLTSDVAARVALANSYAQMPMLFQSQFDLVNKLQSSIMCRDGTFAYQSSAATSSVGTIATTIQLSTVMKLFFNVHSRVDAVVQYSALPSNSVTSLQLMTAREVDAGFATPELVYPSLTDSDLLLNNNAAFKLLPAFMTGLVPIFYLDPRVIYATGPNITEPLYPLIIDTEVFANVFSSMIYSWLDPQIARLNPGLVQRFLASGVDPSIRPIVCCKSPAADLSATNQFLTTINGTKYIQGLIRFPTDVAAAIPVLPNKAAQRFVQAEYEANMVGLVMSINGAIGFKPVTSFTADQTLEFQMLPRSYVYDDKTPISEIRAHALSPTKATLNSCAMDTFNPQTLDMFPWKSTRQDCWPMSYTAQVVVPASYSGTACKKGNHTLALMKWLLDTPTLTDSATQAGVTRVTDIPMIHDAVIGTLNYITCDGVTMLITLPVVWTLTPAIAQFTYAAAAIGWIACIIVFIFMWKQQHTTVFRSASVPSMTFILIGICTLLGGAIALVQRPTMKSCSSMLWLGVLGLTLTFAPLFVKTWRIYKIFDRKQLHVVKISNKKLNALIGVMLCFDLLILAIWQSKAPLGPVTTSIMNGTMLRQSSQCQASSAAMPFIVIIVVTKSILILFGALMGFTTRKVTTTFNESQTVAWSIYNLIFATVVVIPILIIVHATEDAYILLQLFLVLWVAYCTLILLFAPKILHVITKDDAAAAHEASSSRISSHGFSFISTIGLTRQMLAKYITALENQLHDAHLRMKELVGSGAGVTSGAQGMGSTRTSGFNFGTSPMQSSLMMEEGHPKDHVITMRQTNNLICPSTKASSPTPINPSKVQLYSALRSSVSETKPFRRGSGAGSTLVTNHQNGQENSSNRRSPSSTPGCVSPVAMVRVAPVETTSTAPITAARRPSGSGSALGTNMIRASRSTDTIQTVRVNVTANGTSTATTTSTPPLAPASAPSIATAIDQALQANSTPSPSSNNSNNPNSAGGYVQSSRASGAGYVRTQSISEHELDKTRHVQNPHSLSE